MMDWLLGLRNLHWTDEGVTLGWRQPLPLWGWFLLIIGALLLAHWSYSRLLGARRWRVTLGMVRALLLLLAAALLAGPMLVLTREVVEPDVLLVLVDRSASMRIEDMHRDGQARQSRDQALQQALTQQAAAFTPEHLGATRQVLWVGFGGDTWPLSAPTELGPSTANATALRSAIEQALTRTGGKPISGIALLSDGRSTQPLGADFIHRLNQQAVSVFSIPLGADSAPLDLAIGEVDAPEKVFTNDIAPVAVTLDRYPADAAIDPARLTLRLRDAVTHEVLDERSNLTAGELADPVLLSAQARGVGAARWKVEVEYAGGAAGDELILENNQRELALELVDRPLRLLYVEGYPRWEYRYLKNLLIREESIACSVMLISADRSFAQEGDLPLARLPQTAEELKPYDVIVLGDLPADYFSAAQLGLLRDQVAVHGAGLLWIGGNYATPRTYDGTPLGALLPMQQPASVGHHTGEGALVRPTPLAQRLQVLRLLPPAGQGDPRQLWPNDLPRLLWYQDIAPLKPTAEPLALLYTDHGTAGPLAARLRFGAGQSLYLASDDLWRWRLGRGDHYYQQFWTQLIRLLGRNRVSQTEQRARLSVSNRRVQPDQPLKITLQLDDALLQQQQLPRIALQVDAGDDANASAAGTEQLDLLPRPTADGQRTRYETLWRPTRTGKLRLRVMEPALLDLDLTQTVEVIAPDDELRQPAPDHPRLAWLSAQTGGAVVPLHQLNQLGEILPNRARRTPNDLREPLWNAPLVLLLFLLLITLEWVVRKWQRLV